MQYLYSLNMFFDDGVRKAVSETNVTLSAELQTMCSDASQEKPAAMGWACHVPSFQGSGSPLEAVTLP